MTTEDINFTPRSQKLLKLTKKIAVAFNHDEILLPHLIAAFFELRQAKCLKIADECGFPLEDLKKSVYEDVLVPLPKNTVAAEDLKLSKSVLNILKQSTHIAVEFGHAWVSVDHIFLVILDNSELWPQKILKVCKNVNFDKVFEQLVTYLSDNDQNAADPSDPLSSFASDGISVLSQSSSNSNFKFLEKYAVNLTAKVLEGEVDPVFGREEETGKLEDILNRRKKNSAILVGEAGVGKTSVVEGLAQRIVEGDAPLFLQNKIIYCLDLNTIVAGTKYRGEFEDRINKIIEEAKNSNVIIFIDEIHTLVGAGDAEGSLDAANILKPALSNGEITIIGATTHNEFRKKISKDKALSRRFEQIFIEEPTKEETLVILEQKKSIYENFHYVSISDEILKDIVNYAEEFLLDQQFPDKAIDLLDLVCSHVKVKRVKKPAKLQSLEEDFIHKLSENASSEDQSNAFEKLKKDATTWTNKLAKTRYKITKQDLFEILSRKTGLPYSDFIQSTSKKYINLEKNLGSLVFGQSEAIQSISQCLIRHKSGLRDASKPIGSLMFLGSTGVGKTYIAKCLAKTFFKNKNNFIHFDMSEFSDSTSVNKLIGSNPGYVGYEEGGLLVEKIIKNPHAVILFDEIEKAHPKVHQLLLQILEEGRLQDSQGRNANFIHSIIIVTGNIGSKEISKTSSLGFVKHTEEMGKEDAKKELKKVLPLELINRFDDILFFNKLSNENLKSIVQYELNKIKESALKKGIEVKFDSKIIDYIIENISDSSFGARLIKREVQKNITDKLSVKFVKSPSIKKYLISYNKKSDKIDVKS